MGILIDASVFAYGVTHETVWISTGSGDWCGIDVDTGYAARIPIHSGKKKTDIYNNVAYLGPLVQLAINHHLKMYVSPEINDEMDQQPIGRYKGYGFFDLNVLDFAPIIHIDGASPVTSCGYYYEDPKDTDICRRKNEIAGKIVRHFGKKHDQDAFHIATAEVLGIEYFVTMDFKLIRMFRASASLDPFNELKVKIVTPQELGQCLNMIPCPPFVYSHWNASFPVRTDIHSPREKRAVPTTKNRDP